MATLRTHSIVLQGPRVLLRPMTEEDWALLLRWNNDPDVRYFGDANPGGERTLEEVQDIYRTVSQTAFCFIIEADGIALGECWLQEMNLERIQQKYPEHDCRRIDLMIGERAYWDRGIGTEVVELLTLFAFVQEGADLVFGCDIADYNSASLRIFQKNGYEIEAKIAPSPEDTAEFRYDLVARKPYA
jgi:RimJ/RimL family protein N-acetyltransferase